jgi:hypothetical protein
VQVADRAALMEQGWSWLECARFGDQRCNQRVELGFETPTGGRGGFEVWLAKGRQMPVPDCGAGAASATKVQSELRVLHLQRWS